MNIRKYKCIVVALTLIITSCAQTTDSCDDLEGTLTHSTIAITGLDSVSLFKRNSNSDELQLIDQSNGSEFSNLVIDVDLSWTEEQHRFRTTSTIITSFIDWLVSPAMACTLVPYYEEYKPGVSSIAIYSDSDINEDFIAGSDLSELFTVVGVSGENNTRIQSSETGAHLSAKSYYIEPVSIGGSLATIPVTPSTHVFTIVIALDNGSAFEVRSSEVLLIGT